MGKIYMNMKLKNILLGFCLTAGLFSACTSESIDGNGTEEGKDTAVSLILATGEPETKAIASGYTLATEDEIKISNCVVALFKLNGEKVGEMIGKAIPFEFKNGSDATYQDKPAYTLPKIPAKTGKVRILVIANAANKDFESYTSWDDFNKAFTEKELVENDLVKVGFTDVTLSAPVAGTIPVPLAQLTAKVKLAISTNNAEWSYTISKITVNDINKKSNLILTSANPATSPATLVMDNFENNPDYSFYTYENPLEKVVTITIDGILKENNGPAESKSYSFELNRTVDNGRLSEGLCHGTIYNITGKIDITTRIINFTWDILPWSTTVREVSVDIIKPKFLVVKDLEMTMPNTEEISTTFSSSSPVTIQVDNVDNGTTYPNKIYDIKATEGNNGTIHIKSDLPINFFPKYIMFTVSNEDGLSQQVKVEQYPPLYIILNTSTRKPNGENNQNNDKLYQIKTLVANLSVLSTNKNDYELSENGFSHLGTLTSRENTAISYVNELRNNGAFGYPLTEMGKYSGTTNVKNTTEKFSNVTAYPTVNGEENNHRISPNFILASQNGINSINEDDAAKKNCAGYYESVKNKDGSTTLYAQGTWRVPTRSELMLIDVLQNTTKCEVKKILEGGGYRNALPEKLSMMDPRLSSSYAVRCVRDIKE